ncbi:hypothetical protein PHET_02844 [Paragonimus heterotremus]|uniref:PAS domain-containing protein n=1 Tax=Paragonimus heterotremus TaxID=100268 RepID=A0A8J4T161_9TREM|nr:hypothetical protein PHET_02844 [Paragonimus heterotremus]
MVSPATLGLLREAEVASLRLHPVTPSGLRQRMPVTESSGELPTGRLCVNEQKSRIAKTIAHKRKFDQALCSDRPKSSKVITAPHEQGTPSKRTPSDGFPICHMTTSSKTHVSGTISKEFKHKVSSHQRLPALCAKPVAPTEVPSNVSRRKGPRLPLSSTTSDRSALLSQMFTQTRRCSDFGSTGSYQRCAYSPPYHTQHRRRLSLQQMDSVNLRACRVERRKAKSRVAAQVRRNREGQSLMLLQNVLPISNEALNRISAVTQDTAVSLLSVFKDEPDLKDLITSDLSGWLNDSTLSEIPPNSPGTMNLEKSDIIRIAGHTLFLLNNIHHLLGVSQTPSLNLNSQSLYGLLIDPKDNRIVYVTPALAEAVGGSWASFIGAPLHHLMESNLSDTRSTMFAHNRISRRKNHFASQSVLSNSCDAYKRGTVFAEPSTRAPEATHFVRLLKCTTRSSNSPNASHAPFIGCEERISSVTHMASGGNHYGQQRKEWNRGHRKQYLTSGLPFQVGGADWSVEPHGVTSAELIYYCWATASLEPPVAISVDSGINQLTEDMLTVPETDLVSDKRYLSEGESESSTSYCSSTIHHNQNPLKLYLLQPVDLSPNEVSSDSDPPHMGSFIPEPYVTTSVDERLLVPVTSGRGRCCRRRGSKFQGKYVTCHPVTKSEMMTNADDVVEPTENPMSDMLDKLTWDADLSDILSLLSAKRLADQCFTCLDVTQLVVRSTRGSFQACLGLVKCGDKLLGRSFLSLIHPDDLDAVVNAFSKTLLTGSPVWTPVYRIAGLDAEQGYKRYRWVRSMVWVDRDGQNLHCWHKPAGCESLDPVRVMTRTESHLLPAEVAQTGSRSSVDKDCKSCFTAATSDQVRKAQSNICAVEMTRFRSREPIMFLSPELKFLHRTGQNRLTIVLKRNQTPFDNERRPDDSNQKDDAMFQVSSPIHGPSPKTRPNPTTYKSDLSNVVKKQVETAQWQPKLVKRTAAQTRHRLWVSTHHRMINQCVHSSTLAQRSVFVPHFGDVPISSKHCRMQRKWASHPGVYAFSSNKPPSLLTDTNQGSGSSTSNNSSLVDTPGVGNATAVSLFPPEPQLTGLASMVDDLLGHKENRQNPSVHFVTRQSCK